MQQQVDNYQEFQHLCRPPVKIGETIWEEQDGRARDDPGRSPGECTREINRLRKATVALAHAITIIVMAYHILKHKVPYKELGADYFDRLNVSYVKYHFTKREPLGKVTLEPLHASAWSGCGYS